VTARPIEGMRDKHPQLIPNPLPIPTPQLCHTTLLQAAQIEGAEILVKPSNIEAIHVPIDERFSAVRAFLQAFTLEALSFMPVLRLKLLRACDQWHSSRVFTFLTGSPCKLVQTLKVGWCSLR
jgi:hypothetical protein